MAGRGIWNDADFEPSRPRPAKGGIRSQSKQDFGDTWWARRWSEGLERFDIGARLSRGQSYARNGQVLSIQVETGIVNARVQGSRTKPYEVTIKVKTLSPTDWAKIFRALGRQVLFAAKLLAGEMPRDIEQLFQDAGISLFPTKLWDLTTSCSCDDWSNPCKHTAAIYYLLGEEFDRDPFLLFMLRGLKRDELMAGLGAVCPHSAETVKPVAPPEPLTGEHNRFWGRAGLHFEESSGEVEIPRTSAPQARQLGGFPFWRGETPFLDSLVPIYEAASIRGLEVLLGAENPVEIEKATPELPSPDNA